MTSPPFMSMMPGPARRVRVERSNFWNGLSRLEDGIEVADQQDASARAGMLGDQVAGTLERRRRRPIAS